MSGVLVALFVLFLLGIAGYLVWKVYMNRDGITEQQYQQLSDELRKYNDTYVHIPPEGMFLSEYVVRDVCKEIAEHIQFRFPELGIDSLDIIGSCTDRLKVVVPDEFDVVVPVPLRFMAWETRKDLDNPGFSLLRKRRVADYLLTPFVFIPHVILVYIDKGFIVACICGLYMVVWFSLFIFWRRQTP